MLNLSLAVNYAMGGMAPWSYHAVNLAIHILAALLLLGVIRRTLTLPGMPAHLRTGGNRVGRLDRADLGRPSAANGVGHLHQPAGGIAGVAVLSADALLLDSRRQFAAFGRLVRGGGGGLHAWAWPARR